MSAAIDYGTRTVRIYRGAYDAAARTAIAEHVADMLNPHGTTKTQVGLGNVDNTSDAAKPVSDDTAAALALKAPLASPALTGTPTTPTAPPGTVDATIASAAFVQSAIAALDVPGIAADLAEHTDNTNNPHSVDKTDVGLGLVANLAPADLPISDDTAAALALKAPLASPALTGTPTVPTAAPGTATLQAASTEFVAAADAVVAGSAAAAQADATEALAGAAAAQEDADQAILDAAAAQSDADAAQAAADAAQADATQALADAAAAQAAADAAQATADEALAAATRVPYGESKTGTAADAVPIDPAWIATSPAGSVIRVVGPDAATDDPQTIAPIAPLRIEPGRSYSVRWKVQRVVDPIDPLNDSVSLGIAWLTGAAAGNGEASVDDIALLVADGIAERTVRIGVAPLPDDVTVDFTAPGGTIYVRPFVDLYGEQGTTDIIALGSVDDETAADTMMVRGGTNAHDTAIEELITAAALRPEHGNALNVRPSATAISRTLAARFGDDINIRDYALGDGSTETSAIAAFFAKVQAGMGPVTPIAIPATARGAYLPGGIYKSAQTIIPMIGPGYSLTGDGRLTQLKNVTLRTASQNQTIANLRLLDDPVQTNTGIEIGYILSTISNVEVNSKLVGIHCRGDLGAIGSSVVYNSLINTSATGVLVNGNDQRLVGNRIIEASTAGVKMIDGGSLTMLGNWVQGVGRSLHVEGSGGTSTPIESYVYANTFTNDTNAYYREWNIASIVSSDAGASITVTFTTPHELSPGVGFIAIAGTGVPSYDGYRTWVSEVLSATSVKLGRHWDSDVTNTGTVRAPGVDVDLQSIGGNNSFVRNFRFALNNTNVLRLNGTANISFLDRLKTQIWFEGTGSQNPNNILIFRFPDGEYGGGAQIDAPSNTIRNGDVRPSGPGALLGYGEIGMLRTGITSYTALMGSLKMGVWVPFTEGGFVNGGGGNTPLYYNGVETLNTLCRITSNGVDHNIQATSWGIRDPRSWDITSIVSANAGASILVTLRTNARVTPGIGFVRLAATGVTGYNSEWAIEATPAANQVQLGVAYISSVGAVGTMTPVGRSINFREGGVLTNGLPGSPTGLDFTLNVSSFRGVADDTVFGNAILRFNAPISTTPAGETRTGGFIVVPGNPTNAERSIFIGTPTGSPNLFGNAASIRALISPSMEIRSDGSFNFWAAGSADQLGRISGVAGLDSFINLSQNAGTILRIGNNNGGAAAWAGFEVRNAMASVTSALRVGVNGTGYTTAGSRHQDAGMVIAEVDLGNGLDIGTLGGATADIRFYTSGVLQGTMSAATLRTSFTGPLRNVPASAVTLGQNGSVEVEATSNTTLTIRFRGLDGVTRSHALAMA